MKYFQHFWLQNLWWQNLTVGPLHVVWPVCFWRTGVSRDPQKTCRCWEGVTGMTSKGGSQAGARSDGAEGWQMPQRTAPNCHLQLWGSSGPAAPDCSPRSPDRIPSFLH